MKFLEHNTAQCSAAPCATEPTALFPPPSLRSTAHLIAQLDAALLRHRQPSTTGTLHLSFPPPHRPQRTSLPSLTPHSCATRAATLMAATRRGCVHPILPALE